MPKESLKKIDLSGLKNRDKQGELLRELADDAQSAAHESLITSPYWAPIWDTSMDITRRDQGGLMFRHLDETLSKPVTSFGKLVEVKKATAEAEESLLRKEIGGLPTYPEGLGIAIGVDGASVNLGWRAGLAVRLGIPAVHCGGHKTALPVTHAEKGLERIGLLGEHFRGISTDLWASTKKSEEFRQVQGALGLKTLEMNYAPKTRWIEIRKVSQRYVKLLGPLDIFYESAACEDQAAKGRLRYIRDVRYVYLSHFLVDALLPLKILNKTQQRDSVLVCELGSGVLAVTKVIDGLRTTIGESEKLFWSCFNESKMVYEKDSRAVNLKWQGGPLLRGAGYNIATTLEKDRTEVIDAFVNDLKTFTVDD
jgi:hypothetical protein